MRITEALDVAKKKHRAIRRCAWSTRTNAMLAWGGLWRRQPEWTSDGWQWRAPHEYTPTLVDLLADDWETVRP